MREFAFEGSLAVNITKLTHTCCEGEEKAAGGRDWSGNVPGGEKVFRDVSAIKNSSNLRGSSDWEDRVEILSCRMKKRVTPIRPFRIFLLVRVIKQLGGGEGRSDNQLRKEKRKKVRPAERLASLGGMGYPFS